MVHHINGDGLDNRRCNLAVVTNSQNQAAHRRTNTEWTSLYRGVHWSARDGMWRANIKVNYRTINVGRFADEESAARARDNAALEYFGEFAHLNFPEVTP